MNIENYVVEELNKMLEVPVFGEDPEEKPSEYVLTQLVGRLEKNFIVTDSIAFKCHSDSKAEALELNEVIQDNVKKLIESSRISAIKLKSSYETTDTNMKRCRYQTIFDITYKR